MGCCCSSQDTSPPPTPPTMPTRNRLSFQMPGFSPLQPTMPTRNRLSFQMPDTWSMQEARRVQPVRSNSVMPTAPIDERFAGLTIGRNDGEQHEPPQSRIEDRKPPSKHCLVEVPLLEEKPKSGEIVPILDDDDDDEEFCPICLEGYNMENPNLSIPCKHDYHLSCILEWMERSCLCPICSQVIVLE